jgi:5-methylcytosine-specific restriction endonuclease McrA
MKKHTKLYLRYFGFDESDFIPCEVCGDQAVDIHHIECRGMGGTKEPENIYNLMAVCRKCHEKFGDKKEHKEFLKEIHLQWLSSEKNKCPGIRS